MCGSASKSTRASPKGTRFSWKRKTQFSPPSCSSAGLPLLPRVNTGRVSVSNPSTFSFQSRLSARSCSSSVRIRQISPPYARMGSKLISSLLSVRGASAQASTTGSPGRASLFGLSDDRFFPCRGRLREECFTGADDSAESSSDRVLPEAPSEAQEEDGENDANVSSVMGSFG